MGPLTAGVAAHTPTGFKTPGPNATAAPVKKLALIKSLLVIPFFSIAILLLF
jgi:hypothetical protein